MSTSSDSPADEPCDWLAWDTEFFGVNVARVRALELNPSSAAAIDEWCRHRQVDLLYFLASSDSALTQRVAQQCAYQLTDLRSTYEQTLDGARSGRLAALRIAVPDDLAALEALARSSHTDSRFYYDGRIPTERCDALFTTWIRNSVAGFADAVLVVGPVGQPLGYVTVKLDRAVSEGSIGLIAVASGARGQGLGRLLVEGALEWMAIQGLQVASVVTQGRNITATRLYERCGFVARSLQLYYHRWFPR